MEEQLQNLYQWSLANNHIPKDLPYEQFAGKLSSEGGLRAYYDKLGTAAGGWWADFSPAYLPKKKDLAEPSPAGAEGSSDSSSSPNAPAPPADATSASEPLAPWQ